VSRRTWITDLCRRIVGRGRGTPGPHGHGIRDRKRRGRCGTRDGLRIDGPGDLRGRLSRALVEHAGHAPRSLSPGRDQEPSHSVHLSGGTPGPAVPPYRPRPSAPPTRRRPCPRRTERRGSRPMQQSTPPSPAAADRSAEFGPVPLLQPGTGPTPPAVGASRHGAGYPTDARRGSPPDDQDRCPPPTRLERMPAPSAEQGRAQARSEEHGCASVPSGGVRPAVRPAARSRAVARATAPRQQQAPHPANRADRARRAE
jgi:hypothetical protein